jgi:hypothetical protein
VIVERRIASWNGETPAWRHGVLRIHREVQNGGFKLRSIGIGEGNLRIEFSFDFDVLPQQLTSGSSSTTRMRFMMITQAQADAITHVVSSMWFARNPLFSAAYGLEPDCRPPANGYSEPKNARIGWYGAIQLPWRTLVARQLAPITFDKMNSEIVFSMGFCRLPVSGQTGLVFWR